MMKPMRFRGSRRAVLVLTVLLSALPGCEKPEGPAERAGKNVDKATEKTGEQIEKIGERLQDAANSKPADSDKK